MNSRQALYCLRKRQRQHALLQLKLSYPRLSVFCISDMICCELRGGAFNLKYINARQPMLGKQLACSLLCEI